MVVRHAIAPVFSVTPVEALEEHCQTSFSPLQTDRAQFPQLSLTITTPALSRMASTSDFNSRFFRKRSRFKNQLQFRRRHARRSFMLREKKKGGGNFQIVILRMKTYRFHIQTMPRVKLVHCFLDNESSERTVPSTKLNPNLHCRKKTKLLLQINFI